jgi:hypothetical protein
MMIESSIRQTIDPRNEGWDARRVCFDRKQEAASIKHPRRRLHHKIDPAIQTDLKLRSTDLIWRSQHTSSAVVLAAAKVMCQSHHTTY